MSIQSITANSAPVASLLSTGPEKSTQPRPPPVAQSAVIDTQLLKEKKNDQPSPEDVAGAVKAVSEFVGNINSNLKFNVDDETGQTIIKVVDSTTNEVIKQIPSEDMVAIAKAMDKLKGLLIQQKV